MSLQAMPRSLSRNLFTAEALERGDERAAAFEAAEAKRRREERTRASGIPRLYADASLAECPESVQAYAALLKRGHRGGLLIQGQVGRGKTYAACAILRDQMEVGLCRFATMQGILESIRATFDTSDRESDLISRYRNTRVLAIDDLGKEKPSEFALSQLFAILDARVAQCRPTIITTNYTGSELLARLSACGETETAKAIISRMSEFSIVRIDGKDRRRP